MDQNRLRGPDRLLRRNWLLGVGTLIAVSGSAGCLGGDNSEDPSADSGEDEEEIEGNETGTGDSEDDDRSTSETSNESIDENESANTEANDSEGNQADWSDEGGNETGADDEGNDNDDTANESDEQVDNSEGNPEEGDSGNEEENASEDGDDDQDDSREDGEGNPAFEHITINELSYRCNYPAEWNVIDADEGLPLTIVNDDETAWIYVDIRETSLILEEGRRNFRETFEPNPSFEIHEDEPMTLSSGEEGQRFVMEITEDPQDAIFVHELLAHEHGQEYITSVQISRPEYDDEYAELAEQILASVELS